MRSVYRGALRRCSDSSTPIRHHYHYKQRRSFESSSSSSPSDHARRYTLQELFEMRTTSGDDATAVASDEWRELLRQVSIRLESQEQALNDFLLRDGQRQQNSPSTSVGATISDKSRVRGGVIRATNGPLLWKQSWKEVRDRQVQQEEASKKRQRLLSNLLWLHRDTIQLCEDQYNNNKTLWNRFAANDRNVLKTTLEQIRSRHAGTVENLIELWDAMDDDDDDVERKEMEQRCLHPFLRGRLSVQLLCDHGVRAMSGRVGGTVSSVKADESLAPSELWKTVLDDAVTEARHMCEAHYQASPEVSIQRVDDDSLLVENLFFVRSWIHHVLVEVLKNAMASSIEQARLPQNKATSPLPLSIKMDRSVYDDKDDSRGTTAKIHVADQGLGCDDTEEAFAFGRSGNRRSGSKRWDRLDVQQSYAAVRSPLQSLGVGLPTSRHMMEYWRGGRLELSSINHSSDVNDMQVTGCTATLSLPVGGDTQENF